MKTIRVTIEGISPLLLHRFSDKSAEQATAGSTANFAAQDRGTPREQAAQSLYLTEDGKCVMPGPNLYRAFIDAGVFTKIGKRQLTSKATSLIPTGMWVDDVVIEIISAEPWRVDARPVRIPSTGGRIIRYRPCFDTWRMTFTIRFDESVFNERLIREIVDNAGAKIGLGDFRPACKGPFGRFKVVSWEIE